MFKRNINESGRHQSYCELNAMFTFKKKKTGENNKKQLFLAFFVSYQIRNSLKTNRETAGLKVQAKKNKNQIGLFCSILL